MKLRQWKEKTQDVLGIVRVLMGIDWAVLGVVRIARGIVRLFQGVVSGIGELSTDFFRYVLLFFEGGIYLNIKFCFLLPISHILHACKACSLVTCIGAEDSHIHQGILICPVGHPLLHRTIAKGIKHPTPFLSGRSPSYMTFCAQMWDLLEEQAIAKLKFGPNRLRDWGTAWLLRENQTRGGP